MRTIADRPYYVSAFLAGALETWGELEREVESEASPVDSAPDDLSDAVAPMAYAPEPPSAHCAVQASDAEQASQLTDHPSVSGRRDAVTLALAAVAEDPKPPPAPPRARPVLSIVRDTVADLYTNARDWPARELPMDYGS
jgi:hypothetical protein